MLTETMKRSVIIASMAMVCLCSAVATWAVEPNSSAIYIQRTMKALEESTAENPASVRVLFYGQSIVAQNWTSLVQKYLKERYPTVKFFFANKAIGGYTSPVLIRTAESDLYPWYPDLLFFHVYGDIAKYEGIVKNVRERTSAEIILWTSHLSANQDAKAFTEKRDQRSKDILAVAERNQCMVIDLNKKWCELLLSKNWKASELLRDSVHLKDEGCRYYADFIKEELVRIPNANGVPAASGTITTIPLTDPAVKQEANGTLTLTFTGNRVCAVSNGKGDKNASATLLLDGKKPNGFKELWATTRPGNGPTWMPAVNAIGWNSIPVKEDWTLTATPDSAEDGSVINYKLTGSVTGPDGSGSSQENFVSDSGRVIIEKDDFAAPGQFKYFKVKLPKDFKVKWSTYPLFADPYRPTGNIGERIVLVQNCTNAKHTLTIVPENGKLGIDGFIVNTPAKK